MLNPITKDRNYLLLYLGFWLVVILVNFAILYYSYDIPLIEAIAESAIFNVLFAILGLSMWYIVRFSLKGQSNGMDLILNHLIVASVTVGIWFAVGFYSLKLIFAADPIYNDFLQESITFRIIYGILIYSIFIMLYYVMMYYEDLQEKIKIESKLNQLVKEAELSALKSQINPHFLFNSLNSINSLTISDPSQAQEMLIKLSDFLRYSLSHDKNEKASLDIELENLHRYLAIEKVRFGKRMRYVENINDICKAAKIPNMILQPLVENCIKHGVYNSTEEILIELECIRSNGFLSIKLTNDYDPLAEKRKGEGIGLRNIRQRLELIYQRKDLLEINKGHNTFEAVLKIPAETISN